MRFSLSLHQFEVCYWMSFAKQRGFRLQAEKLTLSTEYNLSLSTIDDGLKHRLVLSRVKTDLREGKKKKLPATVLSRQQAMLNIIYMNCELSNGEIWLQSAASDDTGNEVGAWLHIPPKFALPILVMLIRHFFYYR